MTLRAKHREDGWPTRSDTHHWSPAEHAITQAKQAVEAAGASPALTDAINLLNQAQDRVADHVEGDTAGKTVSDKFMHDSAQACIRALRRLEQTARMLEKWAPECFPEINEQGQKHFARVMMEAAAEEIRKSWSDAVAAAVHSHHQEDRLSLDTDEQVFFYEQEFYVLSNFSAFSLIWKGERFDTSEHAYHWEKFAHNNGQNHECDTCYVIRRADSAHSAFKIAEANKSARRPDWDAVKVGIMRDILREKLHQHPYVRRKLMQTGDRELIENSWRDDFWGWGPNRDGQNILGKLWMEIRAEIRAEAT